LITILDYGLGNVLAFQNVYKRLGIPADVARAPRDLAAATHIILPGVGAFDHAMELFEKSGLRGAVEERVLGHGVPVLGVCVGMQMLADSSEEGSRQGLGWVPGHVRKFRPLAEATAPLQLPHMGWNDVDVKASTGLLPPVDGGWRFYFLHSYQFVPRDESAVLAVSNYAGPFACAVHVGSAYGVQFHPEKSHHFGSFLLKSFAELA
jgi:imidazole glycerol-phosphate synthase subunit HisH